MHLLSVVLCLATCAVIALGAPSADSILECPVGRLDVLSRCTITVMSSPSTPSTAVASDFNVVVNGVILYPTSSDNGARFVFPVDTSSLGTYQIGVTLSKGGQIIVGGSMTYAVYGTPSEDSFLTCATGRFALPAVCTIRIRCSAQASCTALASDFDVTANGITQTLTPTAGNTALTFLAPTNALGAYPIIAKLVSSAEPITNGVYTFLVSGTPSVDSSLSCPVARVGEPAVCTITAKASSFQATTALPADFKVIVASSPVPLESADDGATYTFPVCTQNIASFPIVVTLASGQLIAGGSLSYQVNGVPSAASSVKCNSGRFGAITKCFISVKDNAGATTTGDASDFTVYVAGQPVSLTASQGGTVFSFAANTFILGTYSIVATLASTGDTLQDGAISFTVYGNPTSATTLTCDSNNAQVNGAPIPCLLTIKNAGGATTAPVSDFSIFIGGLRASPSLATTNGGFTYSFLVAPPPSIRDAYSVGVSFTAFTKSVAFPVYGASNGAPNTMSQVSCMPSQPRIDTEVTCTALLLNNAGAYAPSVFSDFTFTYTSGQSERRRAVSSSVPVTRDGGISYGFTVGLPSSPVAQFALNAFIRNALVSSTSFRIAGNPTNASTMTCSGANQGLSVKINEIVTCEITVRDDDGLTTGFPSDFVLSIDGVPTTLAATEADAGATIVFKFSVPFTEVDTILIAAALSDDASDEIFAFVEFPILCLLPCLRAFSLFDLSLSLSVLLVTRTLFSPHHGSPLPQSSAAQRASCLAPARTCAPTAPLASRARTARPQSTTA